MNDSHNILLCDGPANGQWFNTKHVSGAVLEIGDPLLIDGELYELNQWPAVFDDKPGEIVAYWIEGEKL